MNPVVRIVAIFFVFVLAAVASVTLGGVTSARSSEQGSVLDGRVADLWGAPQVQAAPTFTLRWTVPGTATEQVTDAAGTVTTVVKQTQEAVTQPVDPVRTRIDVGLALDERRKGLLWYPLYDVDFTGDWSYAHRGEPRELVLAFAFPDPQGVYDDFRFVVDGVDRAPEAHPAEGGVQWTIPVEDGQTVSLQVAYRSRGLREWTYQPTPDVGQIADFALVMTTDFAQVDYPRLTMSPTERTRTDAGWTLAWRFERLVSGYGIGMVMPERVQPGDLAARLSFSAALPLGLFFLWTYVLGLLRGVEIHPINHLFIAAAFFSFNLLFSYTADHLPVEAAFVLSSVVSVGLVVSYLRLVVGTTFALREAGLAQLLYQVGFSLAHFFDGYTGLTITVLGIVTLFALMQLTARVNWTSALARRAAA